MSLTLELEASALFKFHDKDRGVTDHKAWARRIMYREERKDPDLLTIQVKFAKMALEIKDEVAA